MGITFPIAGNTDYRNTLAERNRIPHRTNLAPIVRASASLAPAVPAHVFRVRAICAPDAHREIVRHCSKSRLHTEAEACSYTKRRSSGPEPVSDREMLRLRKASAQAPQPSST